MQPTRAHQRFIIERPRLIQLLDSLDARIILITAPAGYGKSTLARQWAAKRENVLWYEATAASRDVAVLATDLARACDLGPGDAEAIRARVSALRNPDDSSVELAHDLAAALTRRWPSPDALVVLEEHDILSSSEPASRFITTLVENVAAPILSVGRHRPTWATTRRLIYGEIDEVGRDELAFTVDEARTLLAGFATETVEAVWSRSQGWPAAIGLAVAAKGGSPPDDAFGPALHAYFAEELYAAVSEQLKEGLKYAALLPQLSDSVLEMIWGADAEAVRDEALETGFFSESAVGGVTLHPLLREFLASRSRFELDDPLCNSLAERLIAARDWDNAFAIIRDRKINSFVPRLIEAGMDEMLDDGRVRTLEEWASFGRSQRLEVPALWLLQAEISRRVGKLGLAESQAAHAAHMYHALDHSLASRSFALAGVCAHLLWRPDDALKHQELARQTASTREDALRAVWGEILVSHVDDGQQLPRLLAEFDELVGLDSRERLRSATAHLMLGFFEGSLEDIVAQEAAWLELSNATTDPIATSSFLHLLSFIYLLIGKYGHALELAGEAERQTRATHLSFAAIHIEATRVAATVGLKRMKRARELLDGLERLVQAAGDAYQRANVTGLCARLKLAAGDWQGAANAVRHWSSAPTKSMRGELAAIRSLALTLTEDTAEAEALATAAISTSKDVQCQTIAYASRAVTAIRTDVDVEQRVSDLARILLERRNWDSLVLAYRTYPPLLEVLSKQADVDRRLLRDVVLAARDTALASSVGLDIVQSKRNSSALTHREEEVFQLIAQGMKNKEIARALFISESTVKVHVRHILDKLGARSRTEAVLKYHEA